MADLGEVEWIVPEWAAPATVRAAVSMRSGGVSTGGYASLNLAGHVDDAADRVVENRRRLSRALGLPQEPRWLNQLHGTSIVAADEAAAPTTADGAWSDRPGTVCAVLTADCLPVLMCDRAGTKVAAVHAGWRGICAGILDNAVKEFVVSGIPADQILVWFGPAISALNYEVDDVLRDQFFAGQPNCADAFTAGRPGHWYLDLYVAAHRILKLNGVQEISGGGFCTYSDKRFYSYRRQPICGRHASLIWLAP